MTARATARQEWQQDKSDSKVSNSHNMCKEHSILYLTLQCIVFFYLGLQGIIFFYPIKKLNCSTVYSVSI